MFLLFCNFDNDHPEKFYLFETIDDAKKSFLWSNTYAYLYSEQQSGLIKQRVKVELWSVPNDCFFKSKDIDIMLNLCKKKGKILDINTSEIYLDKRKYALSS